MPLVDLTDTPPPHRNPDDFAIVVGINDYLHGIRELSGSINDCDLFCEWLVHPDMGGLNPANVKYFRSTKPSDQQPMRSQVEDLLAEFYDRQNQGLPQGRRLYLFFAGHGLAPPPPDSGTALVMADARPTMLRGLLGSLAAETMQLTGLFREVMLVMDCCAEISGPAELRCFLPHYGDAAMKGTLPYLHVQTAPGSATSERELDHPLDPDGPRLWQGVLTNALLRGLTTASGDAGGVVTAASLANFIESDVLGEAQVHHGDGNPPSPMTFGVARGIPVNVSSANGAIQFQVRDGVKFSVVIDPRPTPGTVRLSPGQYLIDGLDAQGMMTGTKPVAVREGGLNVVV